MDININGTLNYLGQLMDYLSGEKHLKITFNKKIFDFKILPSGIPYLMNNGQCQEWRPETDQLLSLVLLEASLSTGSILVRQIGAREVPFMDKILAMDVLMAGKFSMKGIRSLDANKLQAIYGKAPEMPIIDSLPKMHDLKHVAPIPLKLAS